MADSELEAIRAARLAQLREGASKGADSPSRGLGGLPARPGGGPPGGAEAEEQQAQQDEMKRQLLSQILDNDARERLSRIALVKPQKSRAVTDILIQMARSGQVRQRVSEAQLISLLDQVEQASGGESAAKITINRKKTMDSDDELDL